MTRTRTDLTIRNSRVTTSTKAGYVLAMRCLGLALFAAVSTTAVVATQTAQAQTMTPAAPAPAPHWTAAHAVQFPGCVATGSFVPARIVVVAREGAARTMPYTDATIARIDATWATDDAWDDLYTIGRCAR